MDEAAADATSGAISGMVTGDDAQALEALDMLWGDEFMVGCDEKGWWASRRGVIGSLFRAGSPEELDKAILADSEAGPGQ